MVLDLYSRRVVGWALSSSANAELVAKALEMTWQLRGQPEGVLFHTDQGSQYASRDIGDYLMRHYNPWQPHQYNNGLPPAKAKEKLKPLFRIG